MNTSNPEALADALEKYKGNQTRMLASKLIRQQAEEIRRLTEQIGAQHSATKRVALPQTVWRERPSAPGWYIALPIDDCNMGMICVLRLTQADLDREAPFRTRAVFGPIPDPPMESKHWSPVG